MYQYRSVLVFRVQFFSNSTLEELKRSLLFFIYNLVDVSIDKNYVLDQRLNI